MLLALKSILIIVLVGVLPAISIPDILDNETEMLIIVNHKRYVAVVLHEFFKSDLAVLAISLHDIQGVFKGLKEFNKHLVCRTLT